jgi:multidrug efflux system membrane fusion protein
MLVVFLLVYLTPMAECGAMRIRILFISIALGLVAGGLYFQSPDGGFLSGEAAVTETAIPPAADGPLEPRARTPEIGPPGSGGNPPPSEDVVQVVVTPAKLSDVPIYLSGTGTVIAYNTIEIKASVDGVILKMNFQEGDDVKAGDPLVTIDPTPYQAQVERWQATKQRAEALLTNAKTNLSRAQQLLAKDYATQEQADEQAALVGQYAADTAEAEAQIKFAQYQLDNTIIRSPINGRTGIRHVDPGNLIRAADNINLVTVVQLQPISVLISIPAKDLEQTGISQGLSDLQVFAYAQDGRALLDRGQVQTVNNVVDPTTGTIQLKATFPNRRYRLWPGDFTDCKVMVEKRHNGLTVPTAAVHHGPKGDFVWVIRPDDTAEATTVVVKQVLGDIALLDQGLKAGEKVVVEGQYHLQSGSRVEVVSTEPGDGPETSHAE